MPRTLPPVGTRGRPLRDLQDSPALGASQSRVLGVDEKARDDCEGVEVRVRDLRAEVRPGIHVTISKNAVYRHVG